MGYREVEHLGSCVEMDRGGILPEAMAMGRQNHSGPVSHQLSFWVFKLEQKGGLEDFTPEVMKTGWKQG